MCHYKRNCKTAALTPLLQVCVVVVLSACSRLDKSNVEVLESRSLSTQSKFGDISQGTMPSPRDPQLAVQEEFDAAKVKNTGAAWELFLQRHPDNALTPAAQSALRRLNNTTGKS